MTTDTLTDDANTLQAGGRIEIWNRFLGSWTGDFEIASVAENGYRVRRTSDDAVLPTAFPAADVRRVS